MSDCMSPICGMAGELCSSCAKDKRIAELKAQVKLADTLINGPDADHMGMAMCLDGYYAEGFAENLKEWDRLMEQNDE